MRIPNHIGVIPDGNRRWAVKNGLTKEMGYDCGIKPGLELLKLCIEVGIREITYYGFTTDNTKRPPSQIASFRKACVDAVKIIANENVSLQVFGNKDSTMFPPELIPYTERVSLGEPKIKVNFLVNYGWEWDLGILGDKMLKNRKSIIEELKSSEISRIDMIMRWGGRRRLSGFLPIQSVYSDIYVIDELWPDFKPSQFYEALDWYNIQDVTLGG